MSTNVFKEVVKSQNINDLMVLIKNGLDLTGISLAQVLKDILDSKDKVNIDFIKFLIENNIDIRQKINFKIKEKWGLLGEEDSNYISKMVGALNIAFHMYDKDLIRILMDKGLDIKEEMYVDKYFFLENEYKLNLLKIAVKHDDLEMVKYLLNNNISTIDSLGGIDIEMVCYRGNFEMLQLLIESGLDTDPGFSGAPIDAALEGMESSKQKTSHKTYTEIIKYLIENGADVNIEGMRGISPFTYLFKLKEENLLDMELIQLFIDSGADVNGKDRDGNTPLMLLDGINLRYEDACTKGDPGKTEALRKRVRQLESIIELLVKSGANINAKNDMGMTALMIYSQKNSDIIVSFLLDAGADVNIKNDMTAFDLAADEHIKAMINDTKNHMPQKLVKILTNFAIDKPIKFTTHTWDFGGLKKEYKDFNGYMVEVKKKFKSFEKELKELSPSLYEKIYTFLFEPNPDKDYSWCNKMPVNIGWSSLEGLEEWCNDGGNPFDYPLPKAIELDRRTKLRKFSEVIDLFKQEIEVRRDFKNLTTVFSSIKNNLGNDFNLTVHKLERQFYTDAEKVTITLDKIFEGIKKHSDHKDIEVIANEFEDGTIELRITQVGSLSTLSAEKLFAEAEDGDFADIKANLTNLCDWSVEGSFQDTNFRINYLKSNNVKDKVELDEVPAGFTHILRFYKR